MPREKDSIVEWENLVHQHGKGTTCRMKIPGGWLYREFAEDVFGGAPCMSVALCFVPTEAAVEEEIAIDLLRREEEEALANATLARLDHL